MSKIFDALQKADGSDSGSLTEAVFAGAAVAMEQVASDAAPQDETVAVAAELPPPQTPPEQAPIPGKASRMVSLQLSALNPVFPFDVEGCEGAAEQYRIIRTKVLHHSKQPRTIAITSPTSGDGKTVTAINLAASFALKRDAQVLLVDGDLRRPSVAKLLGIFEGPGLADVLRGKTPLEQAIVHAEQYPTLSILPAGDVSANPAELLDSERWRVAMATFRSSFTYTIIDVTPIAAVADYELIQMASDGVIVVTRPDHTLRKGLIAPFKRIESGSLDIQCAT